MHNAECFNAFRGSVVGASMPHVPARSRSSCLPDKIRTPLYATAGPNRPVVAAVPLSPGKQYGGRIDMMPDCAHFVLNSTSLQLTQAYSSQSRSVLFESCRTIDQTRIQRENYSMEIWTRGGKAFATCKL